MNGLGATGESQSDANEPIHILDTPPKNLRYRKRLGTLFEYLFKTCTYGLLLVVFYLIADTFLDGMNWLSLEFLDRFTSRLPSRSGIKAALYGSLWLIVTTALFAVPIGVSAGIYLQELMPESKLKTLISLNIQNLAGVPSIVYGILGLGLFVRLLCLDRSILAGASHLRC